MIRAAFRPISVVVLCLSLLLLLTSTMATAASRAARNVLGGPLRACSFDPLTGYFRDGYCRTDLSDRGVHVVAAIVTDSFLSFTASRGNDLRTPHPPSFPGLKHGDRWCLCALRWREAYEAGVAPPVDLEASNEAALRYVSLEMLKEHALEQAPPPTAASNEEGNKTNVGAATATTAVGAEGSVEKAKR
jgi:uncharacterized protein (DUF2237 family)